VTAFPLHDHRTTQLVYASRGAMTVHTHSGTWVVPSQHERLHLALS